MRPVSNLVDGGRQVMALDIRAGRTHNIDPLQAMIGITVETFGYFLLTLLEESG